MSLICISVSHHTAPLEVRERFAVEGDRLGPILEALATHVEECVVLLTCNRFEMYAVLRSEEGLQGVYSTLFSENAGTVAPFISSYSDRAAVAHLLSVAAG